MYITRYILTTDEGRGPGHLGQQDPETGDKEGLGIHRQFLAYVCTQCDSLEPAKQE